MPIYDYRCKACEHVFDALQKMSDAPLVDCPECGAPELQKLLSAPRFRLKGQGWYETDFKTGDKRNLAGDGEAKKDAGKAGDKADGKSDSKSDGKSTTAKPEKAAKADKAESA